MCLHVYGGGLALFVEILRLSYSLSKFIFVYMRGGLAFLGGISGWLANQSSVHTTKFVLASIFLDNFSFYRFCLFMYTGYKMKTCTQISDSGFRGKINVVSPSDSAKRANLGRRAGFSHGNAR